MQLRISRESGARKHSATHGFTNKAMNESDTDLESIDSGRASTEHKIDGFLPTLPFRFHRGWKNCANASINPFALAHLARS